MTQAPASSRRIALPILATLTKERYDTDRAFALLTGLLARLDARPSGRNYEELSGTGLGSNPKTCGMASDCSDLGLLSHALGNGQRRCTIELLPWGGGAVPRGVQRWAYFGT